MTIKEIISPLGILRGGLEKRNFPGGKLDLLGEGSTILEWDPLEMLHGKEYEEEQDSVQAAQLEE